MPYFDKALVTLYLTNDRGLEPHEVVTGARHHCNEENLLQ